MRKKITCRHLTAICQQYGFITLGIAASLLTASCSKKDLKVDKGPDKKTNTADSSVVSDVVGKLVVGYQGWFACYGDGSPANRWFHWGGNGATPPSTATGGTVELWPEVSEFTTTYQTGYANLGNGQPAKLFSSYDDQVVYTHFKWMKQYGIDCAALQRFGAEMYNDQVFKQHRDGILAKVIKAAEANQEKFYIMYDFSGWNQFKTQIKDDWTNDVVGSLAATASPAYARQGKKFVVCLWVGNTHANDYPGNLNADLLDVINFFKQKGCYVIIGTQPDWRTKDPDYILESCKAADMITPWTVGGYRPDVEIEANANRLADDQAYCDSLGIQMQPVVFPGFSWVNAKGLTVDKRNEFPRNHGDFLWKQFYELKKRNLTSTYVAMFDEFDEGTAICKVAEDSSGIPSDHWFLTLDADGVHVSSDFYLRLTGDGARMMKGQIPITDQHPTPFTN